MRMEILKPLLKYKFRVIIPMIETINQTYGSTLSEHVMCCSIDLVEKLFHLQLRQPMISGLVRSLSNASNPVEIWVEFLDVDEFTTRVRLRNCTMIKHIFELSYKSSEVATHQLTYKFSQLEEDTLVEEVEPSEDSTELGMTPHEADKKAREQSEENQ